jgi:signal transduction histidine kinase
MRVRILHKGLILLLIPAALQGFLLVQLYSSFEEIDRLSKAEEDISTSIEVADQIATLLANVLRSAWKATKPRSEPVLDPEEFRSRMYALMAREKQLVGDSPEMNELMGVLGPLTDESYILLKESRGPDTTDLARAVSLAPMAKRLAQQQQFVEATKEKRIQVLLLKREETKASLSRIKGQIFVSAIAEIVLTLALLYYLLRDVTKRLNILMANAASMPKGKPLTMRVAGGDELSYLDDVLHEAALDLERAAQHRQTLTEMLSHDLRAPLLSANLSLENLLRPESHDTREEHEARVQSIKRNLNKLTSFIEDLLAIDRMESGQLQLSLEAVELRSLVDEATDDLSMQLHDRNVSIENTLVKYEIVADRNRLLQVLVNLISNAIKFSPNGSVVVVSAETTRGSIKVSVVDQGPGIPDVEQARLFEKFHQAEGPNRAIGFGLGLFICKLIVERHGGLVGAESKPGKGTRFWFSLPMDEDSYP